MAEKSNSKKIKIKQNKYDEDKPQILIGDYKDKIDKTKADCKEISDQIKTDLRKKPFQSLAIALGAGIILGSVATSIKKSRQTNIPVNKYKNKIQKSKEDFNQFSNSLKEDIKENPIKSLTLALGIGALIATLGKKRGKEE